MAELTEKIDQAVKAMVDQDGKYLTFSLPAIGYASGEAAGWAAGNKKIMNSK